MKVLHVINSLALGGAERLLSDLLPELVALGVECSVLALDARGDVFSAVLRQAGVPVSFARAGGANPYSPLRLFDIHAAIRGERPAIVHAHLGPSFHWCALAGPASRDYALVATEHASVNRRMHMPLLKIPERFFYGRYDSVACVSEDVARAVRDWLGVESAKLPVVPNGINVGRFAGAAPAPDLVLALGGRTGVAMVARFVPAKDHATALAALALLPPEYVLVLAGDGPGRAAAEAQARELGIAGRCLFLGGRNDVPEILAACGCYLQTSKAEGFGIAALEAMASGLPVVSSDVPGIAPLVAGAGSLFRSGDAAACAAAVRVLVTDRLLREKYRQAGLERARTFSINNSARSYARIYEAAIAGRADRQSE